MNKRNASKVRYIKERWQFKSAETGKLRRSKSAISPAVLDRGYRSNGAEWRRWEKVSLTGFAMGYFKMAAGG